MGRLKQLRRSSIIKPSVMALAFMLVHVSPALSDSPHERATLAGLAGVGVVVEGMQPDAPKGYRGIPWGTPMAIVRQRLEAAYGRWDTDSRLGTMRKEGDYRCDMSTPVHVSCHEDFPFWDAKMLWGPEISGVGRTLEGIRLGVNIVGGANNYPQAKGAFVARYGQPHKIETVTFRTRYGGEVRGEVLVWESGQVLVRLQEHCDFIYSSCGEIFTKRYLKQWEELEIERARQRGKALP